MNIQGTAPAGTAKADERGAAREAPGTSAAAAMAKTASTGVSKAKSASEAEPTSDELKAAVAKLNDSLTTSAQDLQFSVDEDSKKTVVKLIDRTTHEVLRQMPSKEALEIARSLDKAIGKLIDHQA